MKELYEYTNYAADISYLTNTFIYEYDISKANISILYEKGLIDASIYNYLSQADKLTREIYVGKMEQDKSIKDALEGSGFKEARQKLFVANNIKDNEVLSIKKDSVYVIGRQLENTIFGKINFVLKGRYTSFYKIYNLELYYYYNSISKKEWLDVKGIKDEKLQKHEKYFLDFLKDIFYSIQVNGPEITMQMLKDFYNDYITLNLPIEYYRKFDMDSDYHYKIISGLGTGFKAENVSENEKNMLDITYNAAFIMEIQRILVNMYFNNHRR